MSVVRITITVTNMSTRWHCENALPFNWWSLNFQKGVRIFAFFTLKSMIFNFWGLVTAKSNTLFTISHTFFFISIFIWCNTRPLKIQNAFFSKGTNNVFEKLKLSYFGQLCFVFQVKETFFYPHNQFCFLNPPQTVLRSHLLGVCCF